MNAPRLRLGPVERLVLAARIASDALFVWRRLRREPLPELVRRLGEADGFGSARSRSPIRSRPPRPRRTMEPRGLGRIVHRVMNLGPFRPRCITMCLVLYRALARQGTPAELVLGLPAEPKSHEAHSWVEVEGRDVGPPPGRMGHRELARYGGGGGGGGVTAAGADPPTG